MLKLYNSLSKKIEDFIPLKEKEVKMYVCGITPYDTTHLGHAFTYIFFDVLLRFLNFQGYKVNYVQNVTDIDDDILKKAKETGKNWKELGEFWTNKFLNDLNSLNIIRPTYYIKATDSITMMIRIIIVLIQKSFAYEKNGNVYFEVKKFKDYGKLSGFNEKQMLILLEKRGGNINDPLKKNPLDFLLWQKSKEDEPFWESPWPSPTRKTSLRSRCGRGKGRPGWHIECSAMINRYLGEQIDIHGGGKDLIFPHHESEIAQSESFSGKKFVHYWMHTAMVMYQGEKMAKSLGNLVMVSDLLKKYSPNAIRFLLLSHHYRIPWEFDESELQRAEQSLLLIRDALNKKVEIKNNVEKKNYLLNFIELMNNDVDTPNSLELVKNLAREILANDPQQNLQDHLKKILSILGFSV